MLRLSLESSIVVLAATLGMFAQDAPKTFKSTTALVEVDIIARDRDGRFVSGLTADDFDVFEEGKPQPIQHFYLVTENPTSSTEPRPDAVLPRSPDRTGMRYFVFLFDSEHLSNENLLKMKQSAVDFVNAQLHPGDMAGVFVSGRLAHNRLTTDRQELLDAIRAAEPSYETPETRAKALLEFPRIDSYFDAARLEAGDRELLGEIGAKVCGGDQARQCAAEGGREFLEDALQRKARRFIDDARRAAQGTLQSIAYIAKNLGPLEGRKTLILLSEGFYVENSRGSLPVLAGQAARAGITIYAIDARGTKAISTVTSGDASLQTAGLSGFGDTSDEPLDILAAETGGLTVRHIDDFTRALSDVAADTSTYYVLAYSPENTALDGTFRRITLKAKWSGLSVRARRGYVASPLPPSKRVRTR